MDVVLFCFTEKWWDWERLGFGGRTASIARELSRHPAVRSMLVVNTPTGLAARLVPGRTPTGSEVLGPGLRRAAEGCFVLDQTRLLPRERHDPLAFAVNGVLHDGELNRRIEGAMRAIGMREPVVWMAGPTVTKYAGNLDASLVAYDAVDEWLAHPSYSAISGSVAHGYDWIRSNADVVFAVTPTLARSFEGARPQVSVLPNAARVAGDESARGSEVAARLDTRGPRVGYVGVIQERFDAYLVRQVAAAMPDVSFVLVGPVLDERHVDDLRRMSNVRFAGKCRPEEVPHHLLTFDACILPHVDSELTRNMDPVKLHEYAFAGKPTVASDIPGLAADRAFVRTAREPCEWVAHLRDALSGAWKPSDRAVRDYRAANNWTARVDTALSVLADAARATMASAGRIA